MTNYAKDLLQELDETRTKLEDENRKLTAQINENLADIQDINNQMPHLKQAADNIQIKTQLGAYSPSKERK